MSATSKLLMSCVLFTAMGGSFAHAALDIEAYSSALFSADNAINGNTGGNPWLADNRASGGSAGSPDAAAFIVVDLTSADASSVLIDTMTLVGSSDGFGDISRVHVSYSADPTYATATFAPLGDFDLLPANGATAIPMNVTAQFVRLDTLRVGYGASALDTPLSPGNPNFYGLSEIQFTTATGVPEPASVAVLGLGVLGLLGRRRREGRAYRGEAKTAMMTNTR